MKYVAFLLSACVLASPTCADPDVIDWRSFNQGDPSLVVEDDLDLAPMASVYSYLTHVVMHRPSTSEKPELLLTWDSSSQTFSLFVDGVAVTDLVTDQDTWYRPTIKGAFVSGEPTINGFVDITDSQKLMVDIGMPSEKPARYVVDDLANITSEANCDCEFVGGSFCKQNHCLTEVFCYGESKVCIYKVVVVGGD